MQFIINFKHFLISFGNPNSKIQRGSPFLFIFVLQCLFLWVLFQCIIFCLLLLLIILTPCLPLTDPFCFPSIISLINPLNSQPLLFPIAPLKFTLLIFLLFSFVFCLNLYWFLFPFVFCLNFLWFCFNFLWVLFSFFMGLRISLRVFGSLLRIPLIFYGILLCVFSVLTNTHPFLWINFVIAWKGLRLWGHVGGTRTKGVKGRGATRRVLHQRLIYNTFIYDEGKGPSNLFGGSKGRGQRRLLGLGLGNFFLK